MVWVTKHNGLGIGEPAFLVSLSLAGEKKEGFWDNVAPGQQLCRGKEYTRAPERGL
jgi:hypothetical protein